MATEGEVNKEKKKRERERKLIDFVWDEQQDVSKIVRDKFRDSRDSYVIGTGIAHKHQAIQ